MAQLTAYLGGTAGISPAFLFFSIKTFHFGEVDLLCGGENIGGLHFVPTFVISEIEMTSLLLQEHPVCK